MKLQEFFFHDDPHLTWRNLHEERARLLNRRQELYLELIKVTGKTEKIKWDTFKSRMWEETYPERIRLNFVFWFPDYT